MASVLALLDAVAFKKHAKQFAPGAVLPIEAYQTEDRSFATELSHGGSLYLAVAHGGGIWLVAVLEAPETSGIKKADRRKPGWYAPPNTTPVTDLSMLRRPLALGKDLAKAFALPRILTAAQDAVLRELLDAVDAPVIGHVEVVERAPLLDAKLPALRRAAAYLAGGHLEQAIAAIAEAWRTSRASELAELIDRVTRLMPAYHRPLFKQRVAWDDSLETSKVWNVAFETDAAAAMPQLLLNLGLGGGSVIPERARKLAELPLDPRFGARLVELLGSRPAESRLWSPAAELWIASRDARVAGALLELQQRRESFGPNTRMLYRIAKQPAPKLPAADLAAVAQLELELHRREEPQRFECSLVDQIAANPDDDGPYLVYADWLIERERPLGEYIALTVQQRNAPLSPAQARRLAILVEVPYLAGAFDDLPATRRRKRARGIDLELAVYWSTQPRSWSLFAASPLTRALKRIDLVGNPVEGREQAIAQFIRAAPALQHLGNLTLSAASEIAKLVDGWNVKQGGEIAWNDDNTKIYGADLVRVPGLRSRPTRGAAHSAWPAERPIRTGENFGGVGRRRRARARSGDSRLIRTF